MAALATLESFKKELARLVAHFESQLPYFTGPDYNEAKLREDFLNPFFAALGWDVGNRKGLIHTEREVDIEVRTSVSGKQKRADYVFRIARLERFTCEAKKPAETLHRGHAHQAKRDAYARGIPFTVLSDFEDMRFYVVGARPLLSDSEDTGLWKHLHFSQYLAAAAELWELLAYENVLAGSIDRLIEALPKRATRLKGRKGYVVRPDRTRSLDAEFLNLLDESRQKLGSDLLKNNDRADLLEGNHLNEAAQRILDRLVFLRICEDRGIDTGTLLSTQLRDWWHRQDVRPRLKRGAFDARKEIIPSDSLAEEPPSPRYTPPSEGGLYRALVAHIRALDQRPPSYQPFFNGQLFKPHFSEDLVVGDEWLANFIDTLTSDDEGYNFADIKVEILGDAYERFLGKVLRPQGRGVALDEKPEVRKAGGVYYTPRYIVDYIVEQTVGRLLEGKSPKQTEKFRFLDPACGSGSFLIRVYERVMEHHLRHYTARVLEYRERSAIDDTPLEKLLRPHRDDFYVDTAGNVRLTTRLKRQILQNNVFGVDIDAQAVEVTQLSLYLKMLEGENRESIHQQTKDLFNKEALLPALDENIKCGNSLIGSDFSLDPAELVRVNAFDWDIGFEKIMNAGGFDAVVGNPPYVLLQSLEDRAGFKYLSTNYRAARYKIDTYQVFVERAVSLTRDGGLFGFITPSSFLRNKHAVELRAFLLETTNIQNLRVFYYPVFKGASVDTCILMASRCAKPNPSQRITISCSKSEISTHEFEISRDAWKAHPEHHFSISEEGPASALVAKIASQPHSLRDYANAYFGIQTFDREKFVAQAKLTKYHKAVIDGVHINRYVLSEGSEFVDFRESSIKSGGNPKVYTQPRIGVRQIGKAPIATWIPAEIYTLNTIYNIYFIKPAPVELKAVLGLLLSSTIQWFWVQQFFDQKQTFPKIKKDALLGIPLPQFDSIKHSRLLALVDKILALKSGLASAKSDTERAALQNAIRKTDRDIDQLVYQLYGLTPEEIALIEGTAETAAADTDAAAEA